MKADQLFFKTDAIFTGGDQIPRHPRGSKVTFQLKYMFFYRISHIYLSQFGIKPTLTKLKLLHIIINFRKTQFPKGVSP